MFLEKKDANLQEVFLRQLQQLSSPVTIFLVSGIKLQGIITGFDRFCVLLQRDNNSRENNPQNQQQLVYKHAIATVMSIGPFPLFEKEKKQM